MFNYLKWQKTCNTLFFIFTALFLFTCLVIFPFKILYNTCYYSMELTQTFFGYYFFNALLIVLYLLDLFWLSLIIGMVYKFLIHGKFLSAVALDARFFGYADPRSARPHVPLLLVTFHFSQFEL
ncbi:ceramide synthase 4-like [Python bivittatus]|uniref:Ceramide synthase 4-like n=1 Tax=Python bivittatus TaxID=176946 RepID=A0A9F2WMG0_PYTBI|nr:ceramide synthase 4-like [Python bivittatus]